VGRIGSGVWDAASFQIVALRILLHFAVVTTVAILGRVLFRDAVANIGVLSLSFSDSNPNRSTNPNPYSNFYPNHKPNSNPK